MHAVYSRLVELSQDQLLQCWQEHSTHGQTPRTSTGGARRKDSRTRTTERQAAHGKSMKTSSTPSSRATSSSSSVRHIWRVLVTACSALSSLHSRHTLGMSCSEGGGGRRGDEELGLPCEW